MAEFRTIAIAATFLQLAPILTGVVARWRFRGPRLWISLWLLVGFSFDMLQFLMSRSSLNNHWTTYLVAPLMGIIALRVMIYWQRHELARIATGLMIPLSLAAWLVLLMAVEDARTFSRVVEPMYSVLALGVGVYTIGSRALHDDVPLLEQEWFWCCGALALYYGSAAAVSPLGALLVATRPDLVLKALTMQAAIDIVAYLLVSIGFLCRPPTPSGAWSLPSPSAWRSSWSPSERPS